MQAGSFMVRHMVALALCSAAIAVAAPVYAQDPKPFAEFTFKRVKVPGPGSGNRITVQIRPPADTPEAEDSAPVSKPAAAAYDWYWAEISPSLAAAAPGRLDAALRQLDKGTGVSAPPAQMLQRIVASHGAQILAATIGTNVSPALVLAVIGTESSGRSDAISAAGASGLMQLMPDTASRFGVTDASDPADNISGGVAYLNWLMAEFQGDPILVLAGYNAGENAVKRYEGVPPYAETRAYVPRVLAAWKVARAMCLTPPELISDGCTFALQGAREDG